MKYLKLFESMFGTAEPERVSYDEFHSQRKSTDSFTKEELLYLESVFDRNRRKIDSVEYNNRATFMYNKFTLDKEEVPNNFAVFLYPNGQNGQPICFECYKHQDYWYDVVISQESDYYDEDDTIPGFSEYWRCDEFDSLKKLLDKWL
jgi:hypothetical protein